MTKPLKKIVDEILARFAIKQPCDIAPLSTLISIAGYYDIAVFKQRLEHCLARISIHNDTAIIKYDQNYYSIPELKFSIAHELGHYFLHRDSSKEFEDTKESFLSPFRKSLMERQADKFAAELVMPTNLFRKAIDASGIREPNFELVKYLASEFNTSLTATTIRLVKQEIFCCILVVAVDGKVKWFVPDRNFPYRIPKRGSAINPDSTAGLFFSKGIKTTDPEEMDADIWFENAPQADRIVEHMFVMYSGSQIYSLIWCKNDIIEK